MQNIFDAFGWLRHWFNPAYQYPKIETQLISDQPNVKRPEATGVFLSGGIDSLAALRANRMHYPAGHPGSFKYGLLIYGQNIESDNRLSTFMKAFADLSVLGKEVQLELIPVYTNIRSLEPSSAFYNLSHGSVLAAVAHAFKNRFNTISIAASDNIATLALLKKNFVKPLGSHPLVDPCFSSRDLRIRHDGLSLTRLNKTRLIADWESALQNIRVCAPNWPGENCGRCEKCIRTMLALLAVSALDKTKAFALDDLTADFVMNVRLKKPSVAGGYSNENHYLELTPLLKEKGREDLIGAIDFVLKVYRNRYHDKDLKTKIKHFDSRYLSSNLAKIKKFVYGFKTGK
jgi:hypothetical protein